MFKWFWTTFSLGAPDVSEDEKRIINTPCKLSSKIVPNDSFNPKEIYKYSILEH